MNDATHAFSDVALTDAEGRKDGSFHPVNDEMVRVVDGQLQAVSRASEELHSIVALREMAVALVYAALRTDLTLAIETTAA